MNWANLGDAKRLARRPRAEVEEAYRQSLRLLETELESQAENPTLRSRRALLLAKLSDRDSARSDLLWISSLEDATGDVLHRAALAWEFLGERAEALRALENAFAKGLSATEVRSDPDLAELRGDREFVTLLSASGLLQE